MFKMLICTEWWYYIYHGHTHYKLTNLESENLDYQSVFIIYIVHRVRIQYQYMTTMQYYRSVLQMIIAMNIFFISYFSVVSVAIPNRCLDCFFRDWSESSLKHVYHCWVIIWPHSFSLNLSILGQRHNLCTT